MAHAVRVGVSFYPMNIRMPGTQPVVHQPDMIAKLIEQAGRPGRRRIGGRGVMCRPSLSDMVNVMNHEVGT